MPEHSATNVRGVTGCPRLKGVSKTAMLVEIRGKAFPPKILLIESILATNLPQVDAGQIGLWQISAGYRGFRFCGKNT